MSEHTPEFETFCDEQGFDYTSAFPEDQQEVRAAWITWQRFAPTQGADARPVAITDQTRDELFAEYFEDREGSTKVAEHAYRQGWKDRATYTVVLSPTHSPISDQAAGEPNWSHPKLQALLSSNARMSLQLGVIEDLIDDLECEYDTDGDYASAVTDKVHAFVKASRDAAPSDANLKE